MSQTADIQHPVHDLIAQRWSPRAFGTRVITDAELGSLFEAARWTASCFNDQPWTFVVARREDAAAFARILGVLVEANQVWAKDASLVGISVARSGFAFNGKPNKHAWHDVGAAAAQMTLQAQTMGLSVHQMGGYDPEAAVRELAIPAGHEPVAAFAIGVEGDPATLPDKYAEGERAPRERKELPDVLNLGVFGGPSI